MPLFSGNGLPDFEPTWIVRLGGETLSPETEIQNEGVEWKTIFKAGDESLIEAQFRLSDDVLSFEFRRTRPVPISIELSCGSSQLFQDIDGVRTYALKGGILQSICQLVDSRYNSERTCEVATGAGGCEPLLVKIARDGSHSLGLAFGSCSQLVTNHQPAVSSIGATFDESDEPLSGALRVTEVEAETLIQLRG